MNGFSNNWPFWRNFFTCKRALTIQLLLNQFALTCNQLFTQLWDMDALRLMSKSETTLYHLQYNPFFLT